MCWYIPFLKHRSWSVYGRKITNFNDRLTVWVTWNQLLKFVCFLLLLFSVSGCWSDQQAARRCQIGRFIDKIINGLTEKGIVRLINNQNEETVFIVWLIWKVFCVSGLCWLLVMWSVRHTLLMAESKWVRVSLEPFAPFGYTAVFSFFFISLLFTRLFSGSLTPASCCSH